MTAAQARVLLEALRDWYGAQGDVSGVAFVGRALARLPLSQPREARAARNTLEGAGLLMRGGFLPIWGRLLAFRVGRAVHNGADLPDLPGARA